MEGYQREESSLNSEFRNFETILSECNKDLFLGYKVGGAATTISSLSYLSIQLLIQAGGNESFKLYKGIGSKSNTVINIPRDYFDSLIEQFQRDKLNTMGTYESLKALNEELTETSHLGSLVSKFLSGSGTQGGDDDSDDDGDDGPSSAKRPRMEYGSEADLTDEDVEMGDGSGPSGSLPPPPAPPKSDKEKKKRKTRSDLTEDIQLPIQLFFPLKDLKGQDTKIVKLKFGEAVLKLATPMPPEDLERFLLRVKKGEDKRS